jgi:hypothetical protein
MWLSGCTTIGYFNELPKRISRGFVWVGWTKKDGRSTGDVLAPFVV